MGVAVDYALSLGLDNIWARVQQQGDALRAKLTEIDGVRIHDTGVVRGGIVTFSREGVPSESIMAALSAEKINTSLSNIYRTHLDPALESVGTYIRASVHYVTTDEEIDKLVSVVTNVS